MIILVPPSRELSPAGAQRARELGEALMTIFSIPSDKQLPDLEEEQKSQDRKQNG